MKTTKLLTFFILLLSTSVSLYAQNWLWAKSGDYTKTAGASMVIVNTNENIYCLGGFDSCVTFDVNTITGWNDPQGGNGFIAEYSSAGNFIRLGRISKNTLQSGFSTVNLNHDYEGNIYVNGDMDGGNTFDTIHTGSNYDGYIAAFDSNLHGLNVKKAASVIYSTAFDNEKNTYLAGTIDRTIDHIDTFSLYNDNSDPFFHPKMFLAKLDSAQKCVWVKQNYGATSSVQSISLSNGNLYMIGYADSCIQFDTAHICAIGGNDVGFLVDLNMNGNIKWAHPYLSTTTYFHSISTDQIGNCYVAGGYNDSITLGSYTIYKTPGSKSNSFIAKYDSTGQIIWATAIRSDSLIYIADQSSDETGNTYIFGNFKKDAIFGNDTIDAQSNNDMFIARYASNGSLLGYKIISNVIGKSITQDADGNAIVTGILSTGTTYFDSIPLTCTGQSNFFLAKLEAITGGANSVRMMRLDDRLVIYANPNTGSFTIEVPQGIVRGNRAQLGIYNSTGGVVKDEPVDISNNRLSIDIGSVQKGIYSVTLSSGQKRYTGRVVVE